MSTIAESPKGQVVVVTGQVGNDKERFLGAVRDRAIAQSGRKIEIFSVGPRMYEEDHSIPKGRILDMPVERLRAIRRAVTRDLIHGRDPESLVLMNTHATFRWKHGLHPAHDFDQLRLLKPEMYMVVLDNVQNVHARLVKDHDIPHTLKDILVWREEEVLATQIIADAMRDPDRPEDFLRAPARLLLVARGDSDMHIDPVAKLLINPGQRRVYPSFPMTHVYGNKELWAEIEDYRKLMGKHFIAFDPALIDEVGLLNEAKRAHAAARTHFETDVDGGTITLQVAETLALLDDIERQIYARDFQMINQSDFITAYVPELPDGKPGLSSGVEREMHHTFQTCKDVYVVWRPQNKDPSPFVTRAAKKIFRNTDELFEYFRKINYV